MHKRCEACGLVFEREPGYFLGSIYINYGLTALIVTAVYFGLFFLTSIRSPLVLWGLTVFCIVFPLWFFRYARSLWMAWDHMADPLTDEKAQ